MGYASNMTTTPAAPLTKPLELYTIRLLSRRTRPGSFEVAFAGDNLGLKTGDTVATSKDGVTAPFKLGRLVHFGNAGGGSLCNDKTESLYVFAARIVKTPFYVVQALIGGEPIYILPGVYLTPAAAFASVEQAKALSSEPERSFGVFEVAPSTKAWHLAKRVLSEAEELRSLAEGDSDSELRYQVAVHPQVPDDVLAAENAETAD